MFGSLVLKWTFFVAIGLSVLHIVFFFKLRGNKDLFNKDRANLLEKIEKLEATNKKTGKELLRHYNAAIYENNVNKILLSHTPIPILIVNDERQIINCNSAAEVFLSYDKEELTTNFKIEKLVTNIHDRELLIDKYKNRKKYPYHELAKYDIKLHDKFNNIKFTTIGIKPIIGSEKTMITILDKTYITKLEKELELQANLSTEIIEHSNRYIWKKDTFGRYTFCDSKFGEDYFGLLSSGSMLSGCSQCIGFTEKELISFYINSTNRKHSFIDRGIDTDKITMDNDSSYRYIEMGQIDNKLFIIDIVKKPQKNKNGDIVGVVASATNRTNEGMAVIEEISRGTKIGTIKHIYDEDYLYIYSVDYTETYEPIIISDLDEFEMPKIVTKIKDVDY
jgi:hypothetical protein